MKIPVKGKKYYCNYQYEEPRIWTCVCPGPQYSVFETKGWIFTYRRILLNESVFPACPGE